MKKLIRFGVSLDEDLLKTFDGIIKRNRYPNRSKALAGIIQQHVTEKAWDDNKEVFGAFTMAYDHHRRLLVNKLLEIQHDYHDIILSSQHLHITHDVCLEIVAVRGKGRRIKDILDKIRSQKGVLHATFIESLPV